MDKSILGGGGGIPLYCCGKKNPRGWEDVWLLVVVVVVVVVAGCAS